MGLWKQTLGWGAVGVMVGAIMATQATGQEAISPTASDLQKKLGVVERKLELIQEEAEEKAKAAANRFDVTVYGRVKFDAAYDTGRTSTGDWAAWVLPQPLGRDDELNVTARDSRFGIRLRAPQYKGLVTTGLVELDFLSATGTTSNSPNPRLRLAYLDVANPQGWALRAGQEWDMFGIYHPNSLDPVLLANAGNPRGFRPQVRVSKTVKVSDATRWVPAVALTRNIGQDLDGGGQDDGADTGLPAVQAGLAFHTKGAAGRPLTLAVSGLYGKETLDAVTEGTVTEKDATDYDSWLVHFAAVVPLTSKLAFQGVLWTGANLDAYAGGIGQGVNHAAGKEIRAQGGYVQLTANATEKLTLGAGCGVDDPKDSDLAVDARTLNSRLYGNAVYTLTPAVSVGVEVSHLETKYKEQDSADAQRVVFSSTLRF